MILNSIEVIHVPMYYQQYRHYRMHKTHTQLGKSSFTAKSLTAVQWLYLSTLAFNILACYNQKNLRSWCSGRTQAQLCKLHDLVDFTVVCSPQCSVRVSILQELTLRDCYIVFSTHETPQQGLKHCCGYVGTKFTHIVN